MKTSLASISFGCVLTSGLTAQLPVGSYVFTLGVDRIAVMKEANARFRVVTISGSPNTLMFWPKSPKGEAIGGVQFKNDKLSRVWRYWNHYSALAGKNFFSAIESATNNNGSSSTITTETYRTPGIEFNVIRFRFPGREVTYTFQESANPGEGKSVEVEEAIFPIQE